MASNQTAPAAAPALDLSLNDRPVILIDRKKYEMRTSDEFSYIAYRKHRQDLLRLGQLFQKKHVNARESDEQDRLLRKLTEVILMAPPAIHDKLNNGHRMEIVRVFSQLLRSKQTAGAQPRSMPTTIRRHGKKSRRG